MPGGNARSPTPLCQRRCSTRRIRCAAACQTAIATRKIASDLFEEVIDEFLLCDELGVNVLAIEHHAGINSLLGANPMLVGILARQTRKVRILSLGTLISLRAGPGAGRRGIRDRRRHFARPARNRLCQIGRHRDGLGQRQPGRQ